MVTEPPVETGVDFTKLGKGKGVSAFEGADSIRFHNVGGFNGFPFLTMSA